jgi:hypothetical protein
MIISQRDINHGAVTKLVEDDQEDSATHRGLIVDGAGARILDGETVLHNANGKYLLPAGSLRQLVRAKRTLAAQAAGESGNLTSGLVEGLSTS